MEDGKKILTKSSLKEELVGLVGEETSVGVLAPLG